MAENNLAKPSTEWAEVVSLWMPKIGESVRVTDHIPAYIVAILIEANEKKSYKVAYWVNGERKVEWMEEFELKRGKVMKNKTGFRIKSFE